MIKHLDEANVGYWEHWLFAFQFATILVLVGLCVLVHAFCPWWFKTTGTDVVRAMHEAYNEEDS